MRAERPTLPIGSIAAALAQPVGIPERIGRYRLIRRLATSGLSEVFLARAEGIAGFEKLVVVKRLLSRHARSPEHIAMFLDEATLAASLHHPNVVQMFDFGVDDGGYFCAMEYVHGRDVRQLILAAGAVRVPLEHTVSIVAGVAAGLHAVHEQCGRDGQPLGTVHRDVSPTNVLVGFDGWVKLIDFGIAKYARRRAATEVGLIKGKMGYMSPEQVLGRPLDRRSDVFTLGILLHELLTGRRLFRGESDTDIMKAIARATVPAPSEIAPGVPAFLDAVTMRALAREPDSRYPSARMLQTELEQYAHRGKLRTSTVKTAHYMRALFPNDTLPQERSEPDELRTKASPRRVARGSAVPPVRGSSDSNSVSGIILTPAPVPRTTRPPSLSRNAAPMGVPAIAPPRERLPLPAPPSPIPRRAGARAGDDDPTLEQATQRPHAQVERTMPAVRPAPRRRPRVVAQLARALMCLTLLALCGAAGTALRLGWQRVDLGADHEAARSAEPPAPLDAPLLEPKAKSPARWKPRLQSR